MVRLRWLTEQPMPQEAARSRQVAPDLKQRFNDWIDARTTRGVETYGTPLMTHNGRNVEKDMTEELLDFCQYQQQWIMELKNEITWLSSRIWRDSIDRHSRTLELSQQSVSDCDIAIGSRPTTKRQSLDACRALRRPAPGT